MKYQGWFNAQTWCVALTLNNTKNNQDKFIELVKAGHTWKVINEHCNSLSGEIYNMAPWAWPNGYNAADVDWDEIYIHFMDKLGEFNQ